MKASWISFSTIIALAAISVHSQAEPWVRIQNDVGTFSFEIPMEHKVFRNHDGFWQTRDGRDYRVQDMNLIVSFVNGTLFAVEAYSGQSAALEGFYERDKDHRNWKKAKPLEMEGTKVKVLSWAKPEVFAESRYFSFNGEVFVLTVASRNGNTESIKRFFDSIKIRPKGPAVKDGVRFSDLASVVVDVSVNLEDSDGEDDKKTPPKPERKTVNGPGDKPMVILRLPNPSYSRQARRSGTAGTIIIKPVFGREGLVTKMEVNKQLPDGLLRQSLFALLRLRYLPQEKDGHPISVVRPVEYNFGLY